MNLLRDLYLRAGLFTAADGTYVRRLDDLFRQLAGKGTDYRFPAVPKESDCLNVLSLCGIGDALWSAVFIPALMRKFEKKAVRLLVHYNGDHRSGRSFDLLKRLSYVRDVVPFRFSIHHPVPVNQEGQYRYMYSAGPAAGAQRRSFDYALIVNTFLERGWSMEQIAALLDLDSAHLDWSPFSHFEWRDEDSKIADDLAQRWGDYAVFYLGADTDNTVAGLNRGGLWRTFDWVSLIKRTHDRTGKKIVIIGAPYDLSYFKRVFDNGADAVLDACVNLIGMLDLPETLAVMKKASFMVGFASGMPISAAYLRTNTAIFWRPQELSMSAIWPNHGFHREFATNWVPRDMLESRRYLDLWYTKDTPEGIVRRMEDAKWF